MQQPIISQTGHEQRESTLKKVVTFAETEHIMLECDGPEFDANTMQRLCEDKRAEYVERRQFDRPEKGLLVFALDSHKASTRSEMTIERNEPLFVCFMHSRDVWMCIFLKTDQRGTLPKEVIFEQE